MAEVTRSVAIKLAAPALFLLAFVSPAGADSGYENREPDVGDFTKLRAPEGHKVAFRAYAEGVQVYRWNGTSWVFVAPEAFLYDQDDEVVGIHYTGPTWESPSGSAVVGRVLERGTPDPDAIPWLLLEAASNGGSGIFRDVTYIQRVNTVGGLAPDEPGEFVGEEARVPYTADYYFYRSAN